MRDTSGADKSDYPGGVSAGVSWVRVVGSDPDRDDRR